MRHSRLLGLVVLLASFSSSAIVAAQGKKAGKGEKSDDSVILKNGTMVTGKVLDDDPKNGVTIKLANGKVRVVPAADVKLVERAITPEEQARDKPKPASNPRPVEADASEPPAAAKKDDAADASKEDDHAAAAPGLHDAFHWGLGVELGAVLSRANADDSLKVLSPWLGAHLALDVGLTKKVYLRIDPGIGTMSRSSSVPEVPNKVQAPSADMSTWTVYRYASVGTKVRLVELMTRVEVGYDFTPMITSRIGVLGAAALQMAKGDICESSTDLGFAYGLSLHPVALRFLEQHALEVALAVDYASVPVKRCTTSVPDGFVPTIGAVSQFQSVFQRDRIGVANVGLSATYLFP